MDAWLTFPQLFIILAFSLRMIVDKNGQELRVDQLSDGEKCTLAMVGDLARRMAIANPAQDDPLGGEGVVLIDELDLHLHPGWQRHVVSALEGTFPNCQFLVATHSPQIVGHVAPERIWLLERTKSGVSASRPAESFGQRAGRILEDVMDGPERPQEIKDRLSSLFFAIPQDELATPKQMLISPLQEGSQSTLRPSRTCCCRRAYHAAIRARMHRTRHPPGVNRCPRGPRPVA